MFHQSSVLSRRHKGRVAEQGDQNHSTSCLFLQRFVVIDREFLNSLFLTSRSTFFLHGIPLSEYLLVASSIRCIPFFLARAHFIRACMCLTSVATVTTAVSEGGKREDGD